MTDDTLPPAPYKPPTALPEDLTAASIAKLTATLDPTHPAAQLSTMNASLLSLLMAEDDQTCLLRRQAQTLDTLFHAMLGFALTPEGDAPPKNIKPDTTNLALALKSQRQCFNVVKSLKNMEYMVVLSEHIKNKPAENLIDKIARRESHYNRQSEKFFEEKFPTSSPDEN